MSRALEPGRASVRSDAGPPSAFGPEVALIFGEAFGWPNLLGVAPSSSCSSSAALPEAGRSADGGWRRGSETAMKGKACQSTRS